MAKFSADLNQAFAALADATRRALLTQLASGPKSVSELAEPFELALPSLLKHLRVLEQSGLIRSEKVGRVRTCQLELQTLRQTEDWIRQHISVWEQRLDRLENHIESTKKKS